jgi:SAM-dependent methyltransferase
MATSRFGHRAIERYLVPVFMPTSEQTIEMARLQAGDRILDAACGTGALSRLAAHEVGLTGTVVGTDINEEMLKMARMATQRHLGTPIEWRQSDAAALPFADGEFDIVLCQYGVEFFADRKAGLRHMARVLAPGGRMLLRVWRGLRHQPFYSALLNALDRHVRPGAGAPIAKAFSLADVEELRALVAGSGFCRLHLRITTNPLRYPSVEEYVLKYLSATPIAKDVASLDEGRRTALLSDVKEALRPYVDDEGLCAPMESYVISARK